MCYGAKDENLILICDLCDNISHTFCVGLGYTVTEGDWFCHDYVVSHTLCFHKLICVVPERDWFYCDCDWFCS